MRLTAGTAFAQMIGILAAPITARLFHPAEVGVASVFTSLLTVPLAVVTLRYDYAVPLPQTPRDRDNLLALCAILLPFGSLLFGGLMYGGCDYFASWMDEPQLRKFAWLFPIALLLMGAVQLVTNWANREQQFPLLMRALFVQSGGQVGIQLASGVITGGSAWCLVIGQILGSSLSFGMLLTGMWNRMWELVGSLDRREMKRLAWKYRSFPLLNSWSSLLNYGMAAFPLVAMASLHGMAAAGHYRYAQMFLLLPVGALTSAIQNVYYSEAARLMHESPESLLSRRRQTTRLLLGISAGVMVLSALLPFLVPLVLGPKWSSAGWMALGASVGTVAGLIATPTGGLALLGFNHWLVGWEFGKAVSTLGAAGLAWSLGWGPQGTVLAFSVASCANFVAYYYINELAVRQLAKHWIAEQCQQSTEARFTSPD
jgi:lipopolysaccharide exporter